LARQKLESITCTNSLCHISSTVWWSYLLLVVRVHRTIGYKSVWTSLMRWNQWNAWSKDSRICLQSSLSVCIFFCQLNLVFHHLLSKHYLAGHHNDRESLYLLSSCFS
jgi:hypothetical protein